MYTYTLARRDLVLGQGAFTTVTGSSKVVQDMTSATLEPFGCDRFHPGWGSVLSRYVGTPTTPTTPNTVYAEISRLVANYVATQAAVQTVYSDNGQANPYTSADLATGIVSYQVNQQTTSVNATVNIGTVDGQSAAINAMSGT